MASSSRRNEQASLPCPAWVWSNSSDVHVAKDRYWFGDDYTPFESFVTDIVGNSVEVVGIGTVILPTKISPTQTSPSSHGILRLKQVLHVPSILCNIIGGPIRDEYEVSTSFHESPSGASGSIANLSDGRPVAYFKPKTRGVRFWEVRLSGPPVGPKVGPSPFKSSMLYMIHAFWPNSERQRYAALQALQAISSGPLTPAEKAWLKTNYGNEFKFLRDYGLSIFKDEDREEGYTILRGLMSDDGSEPEI